MASFPTLWNLSPISDSKVAIAQRTQTAVTANCGMVQWRKDLVLQGAKWYTSLGLLAGSPMPPGKRSRDEIAFPYFSYFIQGILKVGPPNAISWFITPINYSYIIIP